MTTKSGMAIGALMAASMAHPAMAQQRDQIAASDDTGYPATGPLSPSSATSTVSASSVPQAMERMQDPSVVADVSLGSIYAGGDFGASSQTSIWSAALGARVRLGDWRLTASLPWMRIRSRSTFFTGIDSTPVLIAPDTSSAKRTSQGLGDLTLGASYTIAPRDAGVEVELSGRAKLNTATDASRLSSGKTDYAIGADVSLPLGRVIPFASFTYRFLGDTARYDLRDGPAASAGVSIALGGKAFVLASYHYARAATRAVGDSHELFAGASTQLGESRLRLTGFATTGLSNGAADVSGGIALSLGFGRRDARAS